MRGIGEMARDCGLSASALRFYDRAGVLVPAWVDPATGYRWYGAEQLGEARLLARLRRAGTPLADIRLLLAAWPGPDTGLVRRLLDAHLRRLEAGLSLARDEFSAIRALLDQRRTDMTAPGTTTRTHLTLPAPELADALDAVRFAVGTDPELAALAGILFDIDGTSVHTVATDRYRLAVGRVAATAGTGGARARVTVPTPLADAMRALLTGEERADLTVEADQVTLATGGRQITGRAAADGFPDHHRLLALPDGTRTTVEVRAFAESLRSGPTRTAEGPDGEPYDVSVLVLPASGTPTPTDDPAPAPPYVAVNRTYLLQALTATPTPHLTLHLTTPTTPLALLHPETGETVSMLMPVRLDD
ncbi:MerR family transcriptional regulator [Streptomyces sp. J2-1]|uniref:DNA polymerase III subunit beta family protein n=1 Tax=Streptomyces corallincola TaxID=2851888 RepID=UPI001C38B3F3|nr:MerR family transcriptional regulator [Streptomyces corallincola]MBV2356000.1 MerR family transcriptional regulator [Streptomyces corallincola]